MRPYGPITSAAATASGCFVVGRNDGSVGCFQLGTLDPTAPGSMNSRCLVPLSRLLCTQSLNYIYLYLSSAQGSSVSATLSYFFSYSVFFFLLFRIILSCPVSIPDFFFLL